MRKERAQWRPHLYQALQKALRDVRASKYEESDNTWSPSNKQKRKIVAVPEEDIERTSNRQKRKALVEAAEDNIEIVDDETCYRCL
ncbi:unnamed protein product [Cylicocyclus nassatus]|uniref:Uncharacterized protein n=1 Tax=Cylicocyclus nassatus TaxID=53992 RepID=A0AA36GJQ1_CYLNA|nr:unnamed protein product [Cylicocyclus nassatus]